MNGPLDFSKCPCCGAVEDFFIHTDERLTGSSSINITLGQDGSLDAADLVDSEADWGNAKVLGYYADCCMNSLSDEYQDTLDAALGIERTVLTGGKAKG